MLRPSPSHHNNRGNRKNASKGLVGVVRWRRAAVAMPPDVPDDAHCGPNQSNGAGHVDGIQNQHRRQDNKTVAGGGCAGGLAIVGGLDSL